MKWMFMELSLKSKTILESEIRKTSEIHPEKWFLNEIESKLNSVLILNWMEKWNSLDK